MKEKIKKLIDEKEKRLDDLRKRAKETEDIAELRGLNEDIDGIIDDLRELKAMYGDADRPRDEKKPDDGNVDVTVNEDRNFDPVAAMRMNGGNKGGKRNADPYDSEEYREAFMNFVCRGVPIPAKLRGENRSDAVTTTTDASAVIPTTILREIIKEVSVYGNLFDEVRHLNIQGGVQVPILTLKPTATWITANTGTKESDLQKLQANSSVTFSYYGLECKIAQTLLTSVVTLEMFQQQFVPLAAEAMAKALDIAIMNGTGSGEPMGIINDTRVPVGNVITLSAADFATWSGWKKNVFAKMKKAYRGGKFYMAQSTFDGYIDGMVDDNGQPIGRVNYGIDGDERYRFGGRIVDTVEDDVLPGYDDASTNDVVAVFLKPNDYAFNSNLTMTTKRWVDDDTNTIKNKVILIGDGKLLDPYGVLIIKKGS